MKQSKKGLGRGLSALIPVEDMEFLSQVARGDFSVDIAASTPQTFSSADISAHNNKPLGKAATSGIGIKRLGEPEKRLAKSTGVEKDGATEKDSKVANPTSNPKIANTSGVARVKAQDSQQLSSPVEGEQALQTGASEERNGVIWLPTEVIVANPFQPRRHFDAAELSNLAASIKEHGILQPIIVRPIQAIPDSDSSLNHFQLVAGERRWRAAQEAGLATVPAIVREVNDQQALELAVIENVQRHDISPLDAALAYQRLSTEFKLSQERIALRVGKSRSAVANTLRLLDLPEEVQQALNDGVLSEGHGRAVLSAEGEGTRRAAFRRILRDKLSVREAEELARTLNHNEGQEHTTQATAKTEKASGVVDVNLQEVRDELQRLLGTRLSIRNKRRGGQVIIQFSSPQEFERIVTLLRASVSK